MARRDSILAKLGPSAQAQLKAQGIRVKRGRIQRAPREQRTLDGRVFDSKWEMTVFQMLRDAVGVENMTLQPKFILQDAFAGPGGRKIRAITYSADFLVRYQDLEWVVDAKGMETERFKLAEKLFLFRYQRPLIKLRTLAQVRDFVHEVKKPAVLRE